MMSDNVNAVFTRLMLANVKREVKKEGVKVPRMTVIRHKAGNILQFEIWTDAGSQGWFSAWDANEAKAKYLQTLLPAEGRR